MKTTRAYRLTAGACSALVLAQAMPVRAAPAAEEHLPDADQIIARYETFLGGAAALGRVTTRTVQSRRIATLNENTDEVLVRLSKRPMSSIMYHETLDRTFERYTNGCDGSSGWTGYPKPNDDGAPRTGESSTDGVCEQELFYYGYFPLDRGRAEHNVARFEVKARVTIVPAAPGAYGALAGGVGHDVIAAGPRATWLVLSVPARPTDSYAWLYFDVATGALLRRAEAGRGPVPILAGLNTRFTDFIQYRAVGDGTRAPFQFVSFSPNAQQRAVHTSIKDNLPLADSTFARPKDVRRKDKGL